MTEESDCFCIDTLCVTGNPDYKKFESTGAVAVPIYQSATFSHPELGCSTGYDYARLKNPTRDVLEKAVAALDHAAYGFAFGSGMAAIGAFMNTLPTGSHIIASMDSYGGTVRLFDKIGARAGITATYVDTSDIKNIQNALKENTKLLYIETPGNPMMTVSDIRLCAEFAKSHNLLFAVDNTFLSPYFQQPLSLGADVSIQSGTKFLSGHNDTLCGFVTTNNQELADKLLFEQKSIGALLSPFDCFLTIRGIKTLAVRMERQQENALKIAQWLKTNSRVTKVLYTGLPEHPGHDLNASQASGFGSMISFYVDSPDTVKKLLKNVRLIHFAESLGGVESLITYPATQTHSELTPEQRSACGITDTLLRLSVGIENVRDLISDLEQALR